MTDAAVIKAAFSEWQMIKTRKVLQLRFEVPLEQGERVLRILGMPMPHEETWCAIALLRAPDNTSGATPNPSEREPTNSNDASAPRSGPLSAPISYSGPGNTEAGGASLKSQQARERYRQASEWTKAAMRASILCGDFQFQRWLGLNKDGSINVISAQQFAANELRYRLGITSRAEIGTDRVVYERFIALETQYLQDVGKMAEARE